MQTIPTCKTAPGRAALMLATLTLATALTTSTSFAHDSTSCLEAKSIAAAALDKAEQANADAIAANEATKAAQAALADAIAQRDTYRKQRDTARQERDHCAGELAARRTDLVTLNERYSAAVEREALLSAAIKRAKRQRLTWALVAGGLGLVVGGGSVVAIAVSVPR